MSFRKSPLALAMISVIAGMASSAQAGNFSFSAYDAGWYDSSGYHGANITNYFASRYQSYANNFYAFSVNALRGRAIDSATF